MKIIHKVLSLLTKGEKRYLSYLLLPVTITQAVLSMLSIAIMMPFIAVIIQPSAIQHNKHIAWLYNTLGFSDEQSFILMLGGFVLFVLISVNAFGLFNLYAMKQFSKNIKVSLSNKILTNYTKKPYEYFVYHNSSSLLKNISYETNVVTDSIIIPIIQVISHFISAVFIMALLFVVNPFITISLIIIFGGVYYLIFSLLKKKIRSVGKILAESNQKRMKVLLECFGGIKIIKLLGIENSFQQLFHQSNYLFMRVQALMGIMSESPRYILEAFAFGGVIAILLYLISEGHQTSEIFGLLALYVFAGYRLMPSCQTIYSSISQIQGYSKILDNICEELEEKPLQDAVKIQQSQNIPFTNSFSLKNIQYTYNNSNVPFNNKLNLVIRAKSAIGLVGETGSGKTTLVDIILGLLTPQEGQIIIDNKILNHSNIRAWQDHIGYVPQQIYLTDDTITRNIAFGVGNNKIDPQKVEHAARMANLHDFVTNDLTLKYDTIIGERGVRLSGGQIQRIGIARALYNDPEVIVFDEATSSLDTITEHTILDAINALSHTKTLIIVAHRLTTVKQCDVIYMLERGQIVDSGTYDELISKNQRFRAMAAVT